MLSFLPAHYSQHSCLQSPFAFSLFFHHLAVPTSYNFYFLFFRVSKNSSFIWPFHWIHATCLYSLHNRLLTLWYLLKCSSIYCLNAVFHSIEQFSGWTKVQFVPAASHLVYPVPVAQESVHSSLVSFGGVFPLPCSQKNLSATISMVVLCPFPFACSTKSNFLSQSSDNIYAFKTVNNNRNIPFQKQRGQIDKTKLFGLMGTSLCSVLSFKYHFIPSLAFLTE